MINLLALAPLVLLWFLFRFIRIWWTSPQKLMKNLKIKAPNPPTICVDCIQDNMAIIHWDDPQRDDSTNYILVVDDTKVERLCRTSCKLTNLELGKLYKIEVIAENSRKLKSKSLPIFLQFEDIDGSIMFEQKIDTQIILKDVDVDIEKITLDEIKSCTSPDILNSYLARIQLEVAKTDQELTNFLNHIKNETDSYAEQIKIHKAEFDQEYNIKTKQENEVKSIETSKHQLAYTKHKLSTRISTIQSSIDSYKNKLKQYDTEKAKLETKLQSLKDNEKTELDDLTKQSGTLIGEVNKNKKTYQEIDEKIKSLIHTKKELSNSVNKLKQQFEVMTNLTPEPSSGSIFTKDGAISKYALDSINKIYEIMPTWKSEISTEIEEYKKNDLRWKEIFRNNVETYVQYQNSIETITAKLNPSYQHNDITEYQASVKLGGYANVIPKSKSKSRSFGAPVDDSNFQNHYEQVYSPPEIPVKQSEHSVYNDSFEPMDRSFTPDSVFNVSQPDVFGNSSEIYANHSFYPENGYLKLNDNILSPIPSNASMHNHNTSISSLQQPPSNVSMNNINTSISTLQQPLGGQNSLQLPIPVYPNQNGSNANLQQPISSIGAPSIVATSAPNTGYHTNYNQNLLLNGDLNGIFNRLSSPELPNASLSNSLKNTSQRASNFLINPVSRNLLSVPEMFKNDRAPGRISTSPMPSYPTTKNIWNNNSAGHSRNVSHEIIDNPFQPFKTVSDMFQPFSSPTDSSKFQPFGNSNDSGRFQPFSNPR